MSMEEFIEKHMIEDKFSSNKDEEPDVSCVIDFYDKSHFNKLLAKKMAKFLAKKE